MAGRIPEADIERVRAASDLVAIASERMALRRVGRRFSGRCPFHEEKTPSFSINPEQGVYYCFGCGVSGNVFQFLMNLDTISFTDAVEILARRAGIQITYTDDSPQDRARREKKPRLTKLLRGTLDFYQQALFKDPAAGHARAYLKSRGYGRDEARRFGIGWAPAGWDSTLKALQRGGYYEGEIVDAGVGSRTARGSVVDFLRDRLVFPIYDPQGDPVAFAGRRFDPPDGTPVDKATAGPKYLNTPETLLYKKSRTLYGLNWAKADIVARNEAVIVEGYTDVIGFHLAGATHAVATCGTALGEDHLRLLKRYAARVVLAFDGDAAGSAATERTYAVAAEIGLDVRVALLPAGIDPADLAAQGADAVAAVLERQRPLLEFKVDRELERLQLDSAEGQARALQVAGAAIAQHPDATVRGAAARRLARRLGDIPEEEAVARVEAIRRNPPPDRTRRDTTRTARHDPAPADTDTGWEQTGWVDDDPLWGSATGAGPGPGPGGRGGPAASGPGGTPALGHIDEFALAALVQQPRVVRNRLPELTAEHFAHPAARYVARAVLAHLDRPGADGAGDGDGVDVEALGLDDVAGTLARRMVVLDPPGFADAATFAADAADALDRAWIERRIGELRRELAVAESDGDFSTVLALDSQLVAFIERRQAKGLS